MLLSGLLGEEGEVTKSGWRQDEIKEKRKGWDDSACSFVV